MIWVIDRRGARVRPDGLAVAAIVLALSALPSALMSDNLARAVRDWEDYWELAICFLVGAHISRVYIRETSVKALAFSGAMASCLVFVQRAGGLHLGPIQIGAAHRAGGTLYTMTFAGVIYQLIVFTAAAAMAPRFASRRWILLGVAGAELVALLFTMTRGAWLAFAAGIVVLCLLVRKRTIILAGAVGIAVLVIFSFAFSRDQGRTLAVTTFATSDADRNVSTRLVLWDIAWQLFRQHPVFGVGMGDYTSEAKKLVGERKVMTTVDAHNVYLQILATRGLFGFIPFVVFFVVLVRSLARIYARAGPNALERYYAAGVIAVTAAVLVGALTENNVDDAESIHHVHVPRRRGAELHRPGSAARRVLIARVAATIATAANTQITGSTGIRPRSEPKKTIATAVCATMTP